MNIEPLFRRFEELADAPERITALRRVILTYLLHAAVNSRDAIARAKTLGEAQRIRRRELAQNGGRKEIPQIALVTDEDLPPSLSDIPTDLFDRLGNIASIEKGLSQIQSTKPGRYPLVVTAETRSSSESFDFEGAAAIIPLVSSTGHGDASLKRIHYQEGRYAVGNILAVVKPICPELIPARFVYEYLSAFKEELLVSRMVGTANVSLTVNKLKEVPVPLVSGPVLSRIEELMTLCDRLETQQQEREKRHAALTRASLARFAEAPTAANLHYLFHDSVPIPPADLRKAILTLAVQGKLIPQDPNDEPAEKLLSAHAELPEGHVRRRKIMKCAPITSKADLFPDLPSSWDYADIQTLYDLNLIVDYADGNHGSLYPRSIEFGDTGVKFVTARDVANGRVSWDGCALLNEDRAHQLTKGWAQGGDVLLTHNATVGRVAIVEPEAGKFLLGTSVTFYRLNEKFIDPGYFYIVLCSPTWQGQLEAIMEQTTRNQVSIQKQAFFRVPIAPFAEQRRIVAKVEQLMALVDELETQLAAARATAEKLLTALVADLTGTKSNGKVSTPTSSSPGRRGRPRKS